MPIDVESTGDSGADVAGGITPKVYTIGNGNDYEISIAHNMNTYFMIVQTRDSGTNEQNEINWGVIDANTIGFSFPPDDPPAVNAHSVFITFFPSTTEVEAIS